MKNNSLVNSVWRKGEDAAVDYLTRKGYSIISRNFSLKGGEIDIVACKGNLVCFIEVKARSSLQKGRGFSAITWHKKKKIERTAGVFIKTRLGKSSTLRFRFDVIDVVLKKGCEPVVEHFENAFQPEEIL